MPLKDVFENTQKKPADPTSKILGVCEIQWEMWTPNEQRMQRKQSTPMMARKQRARREMSKKFARDGIERVIKKTVDFGFFSSLWNQVHDIFGLRGIHFTDTLHKSSNLSFKCAWSDAFLCSLVIYFSFLLFSVYLYHSYEQKSVLTHDIVSRILKKKETFGTERKRDGDRGIDSKVSEEVGAVCLTFFYNKERKETFTHTHTTQSIEANNQICNNGSTSEVLTEVV